MYIVASKVRQLAKLKGKRINKSFLNYLDRKVELLVISAASNLGSRKTLDGGEAFFVESAQRSLSR